MKGVQCYELFGGIALKIHTFSFFSFLKNVFKCHGDRKINLTDTHYTQVRFVYTLLGNSHRVYQDVVK